MSVKKNWTAGNRMQVKCKKSTDLKKSIQQAVLANLDKMSTKNKSFAKRFISIRYKAALSKHRKSVRDKIMYPFGKG